VGQAIFERYSRASNDLAPPELLSFYKAYRASVRCKVAALRAAEHAGAQRTADRREAEEYLKLADGYVAQLPKPPLVIVRGISGSGKSTLAALLAQRLGARVLRTDEVRRQVSDGLDARARYRPENRAAVYDELFARAESLLRQGLMVLLDGTFLERRQRRLAAETAERCGVGCVQLHCVVSAETAQARIAERRAAGSDASEATPELVQRQLEANEADDARTPPVVEIDASGDREAACLQTIAAIAQAMGEL
jgi:predicted kinase